MVFRGNERLQRDIFPMMERLNSAGLVIALRTYMERVPESMLACSNALGIPIIVLPWVVDFRDLTHSLLTHLVQSQYVSLESVDRLNRDLLQIVMRGGACKLCAHGLVAVGHDLGIVDTAMQVLASHVATAASIPTPPQSSGWLVVESSHDEISRFDSLAAEAGALVAALLLSQAAEIRRLVGRSHHRHSTGHGGHGRVGGRA